MFGAFARPTPVGCDLGSWTVAGRGARPRRPRPRPGPSAVAARPAPAAPAEVVLRLEVLTVVRDFSYGEWSIRTFTNRVVCLRCELTEHDMRHETTKYITAR